MAGNHVGQAGRTHGQLLTEIRSRLAVEIPLRRLSLKLEVTSTLRRGKPPLSQLAFVERKFESTANLRATRDPAHRLQHLSARVRSGTFAGSLMAGRLEISAKLLPDYDNRHLRPPGVAPSGWAHPMVSSLAGTDDSLPEDDRSPTPGSRRNEGTARLKTSSGIGAN
jgi:hypothetical protein